MGGFWRRSDRGEQRGRGPSGFKLGGVRLGERPWLVLGGGGVRGLAHLGAWRVLVEAGFRPAGIVGTSIGALVGACLSAGRPLEVLEAEARALRRSDIAVLQRRGLWMRGLRSLSVYRGDVLARTLRRVLGSGGWEALEIRFQANAVEIGTGRTEWFGIGARTDVALSDAIYASAALPVFYPPIQLPGGIYVDGGMEDALPIARAAELGATGIVAVDVGAAEATDPAAVVERGMLAVHERVFSIMSGRRRRHTVANWPGPPLVYIRPELEHVGTLDLGDPDRLLEAGQSATAQLLGTGAAPAASP